MNILNSYLRICLDFNTNLRTHLDPVLKSISNGSISSMRYLKITTVPLAIFCIFPIVYFSGILNHPSVNDEDCYLPLIHHYSQFPWFAPILETNQLHTSIGPLFFIAHRAWSGLASSSDFTARLLGLCMMLTATLAWNAIGQRLGLRRPILLCLLFLVLPYHAIFAICALAEPLMMCFLLISIWAWLAATDSLQSGSDHHYKWYFCLSGISLGLAENAKQPLITVAIALALIGQFRLKNLWSVAGPLIAITIQIPFWLLWGNIFPPGQRQGMMPQFAQMTGLYPDTSIHLLAVAGVVLWPAVSIRLKSIEFWVICISGIFVWILFGPNIDQNHPDRFRFVGPLLQASYHSSWIRFTLFLPFLAGWHIFCDSAKHLFNNDISIQRQALMLASILSILGFINSPLAFDRYATCFLPLWCLAYWPTMETRLFRTTTALCVIAIISIIMVARVAIDPMLLLK